MIEFNARRGWLVTEEAQFVELIIPDGDYMCLTDEQEATLVQLLVELRRFVEDLR